MQPQPPKRALRFLRWFCREDYLDEIEGDLIELFEMRCEDSPKQANRSFWWQVLLHFRPAYIKPLSITNPYFQQAMLRNNFKIAWRHLLNKKLYAFINITGLAIGMACCLVILLYVNFESSFDKFHHDHEKIFRVATTFQEADISVSSAQNHAPMAEIISSFLPESERVIRMYPNPMYISTGNGIKKREDQFVFADSSFFQTFSFQPISSSIEHSLDAPFSVVLTEAKALKFFGSTDVVGQTLKIENDRSEFDFTVTGVIKNLPKNTHFDFEILASFSTLEEIMPHYNNWHHPPIYLYMETKTLIDENTLEEKIAEIAFAHQPDYVKEENRAYDIQPLASIHLHSDKQDEWKPNVNYQYIQLLTIVAFFALLIACLNYINLATTQSFNRAKEIGVRKVMGSKLNQLINQFLTESFLIVLIAGGIAIVLSHISLEHFVNDFLQSNLSLSILLENHYWALLLGALLIVNLLSGFYPAFRLSRLQPSLTVKGSASNNPSHFFSFRKGLVVFQFMISAFLIIATLLIYNQFQFIQSANLGFKKEAIITLQMVDKYASRNYLALKESLEKYPQILSATISSSVPGKSEFYAFDVLPKEGPWKESGITMKSLGMDEDFIKTFDLNLVEGRGFSKSRISDENASFLVNSKAVERLGWDEPIGQEITFNYYTEGEVIKKGQVIGVIDFHYQSLHQEIEPLILYINKHPYYTDYLSVKVDAQNIAETFGILEKAWKEFHPDKPIDYFFLDDELASIYLAEMIMAKMFFVFALLSVVIACLGIFGLSSFSAQKRSKEISIRKVFGASKEQLFVILIKEYLIIILLANVLVIPPALFFGGKWLENYAYHVTINADIFLISIATCLLVTLFTVSFQSIKATLLNPINSLRSE